MSFEVGHRWTCPACGGAAGESFSFAQQDYIRTCFSCNRPVADCTCQRPWQDRLVRAIEALAAAIDKHKEIES